MTCLTVAAILVFLYIKRPSPNLELAIELIQAGILLEFMLVYILWQYYL